MAASAHAPLLRVAFVAKGTLGDVLPCAAVAVRLSRELGGRPHCIVFAAPARLCGAVSAALSAAGIRYISVPECRKCAPANTALAAATASGASGGDELDVETARGSVRRVRSCDGNSDRECEGPEQKRRCVGDSVGTWRGAASSCPERPCVDCVRGTGSCDTTRETVSSNTSDSDFLRCGCAEGDDRDARLCLDEAMLYFGACADNSLVVFNLFAMEAVSIAESLNARCVAVSPFAVTRPPPPGFTRALEREHPKLCGALRAADAQDESPAFQRQGDSELGGSGGPGRAETVTWGDVDAWLWRVFLDDHGDFREHIGLDPCPFVALADAPVPCGRHAVPRGCARIPLLYGLSTHVVVRPPYWPSSVELCGHFDCGAMFGDTMDEWAEGVLRAVQSVTVGWNGRTAFVTFGSMDSIGETASQARTFAACMLQALEQTHAHAVVSDGALAAAFRAMDVDGVCELTDAPSSARVVLCPPAPRPGAYPHARLFPLFSCVVSHGGAGTVTAALRCGMPHVVFPCMFDQREWAERVEHLGAGVAACAFSSVAAVSDIAIPLRRAFEEGDMRMQARSVGAALSVEDGVGFAVARILALLRPHSCAVASDGN